MKKKILAIEGENSVAKQFRWGLDTKDEITIAPDVDRAKQFLASSIFPVATLDLGTTMDKCINTSYFGLKINPANQEGLKLPSLREARKVAERKAAQLAIFLCSNNITHKAKRLEISGPTLHDFLKRGNINQNK
jgi:hypothetical protein